MTLEKIVEKAIELRRELHENPEVCYEELYASKFNHDTEAIFEDICDRQVKTDRKKLTFPARKPLKRQNIA